MFTFQMDIMSFTLRCVSLFALFSISTVCSRPLFDYNYLDSPSADDYNSVNEDYDSSPDYGSPDINPYPEIHPINTDADAAHYLAQFGYMDKKMEQTMDMHSNRAHGVIQEFQHKLGLQETGELNNETMEMMNKPRCGDPDMPDAMDHFTLNKSKRLKRFVLQGSMWPKDKVLTWKVVKYSERSNLLDKRRQLDRVMHDAFNTWSQASGLKFRKARYSEPVDIEISFVTGSHGDKNAFDGPGKTLAHAFFPKFGGDAHFDDSERWSLDLRGMNILSVAIHEFGHSLGLGHSRVKKSIMYPTYTGSRILHEDDIEGIQKLYGKPEPVEKPEVNPEDNEVDSRPPSGRSFGGPNDLDTWWRRLSSGVSTSSNELKSQFARWYKRFRTSK